MAHIVPVELGERSYNIHIGRGLLDRAGELCAPARNGLRALIVADERVDRLYGDRLAAAMERSGYRIARMSVPSGESSKDQQWLFRIYDRALEAGLERSSCIVALGGGVIGDLAGYAAASYLRGIDLVQIPTSLLAMVDSSVGGKTGINLPQGKNLIGAFHQPRAVIADMDALASLPPRELSAGLAEVIKYGVIADPEIIARLEHVKADRLLAHPDLLEWIVRRSCEIKADVVRQDEREGGLRAILNFGHTIGHAIEQAGAYGAYLHGEAIAMGMVFAARVSNKLTGLPSADTDRLIAVLRGAGLPVEWPDLPWERIRPAVGADKKKREGVTRFVLAEKPGRVQYGVAVPEALLQEVWNGRGK